MGYVENVTVFATPKWTVLAIDKHLLYALTLQALTTSYYIQRNKSSRKFKSYWKRKTKPEFLAI